MPRERVMRALDYLAEQGLLTLKADGVRHRYRRLRLPKDVGALAARPAPPHAAARGARDRPAESGVDLAGHDGCQASRLGGHFGEPLARAVRPLFVVRRTAEAGAVAAAGGSRRLTRRCGGRRRRCGAARPDLLGEPRALARFLCGLSSPRLSRNKMTSERLFGALEDVPFAEVLRRAEGGL